MNEIELFRYLDRIAEAVAILVKRVQVLEEQNASNSKTATGNKPCKIIPMRVEKKDLIRGRTMDTPVIIKIDNMHLNEFTFL